MKTFILIISGQGHSTSTLCTKIGKLENCAALYELFNQNQTKYKMDKFNTVEKIVENIDEDVICFTPLNI